MKDLLQCLLPEIHAFYAASSLRWSYELLYNTEEACRKETKILILTINPRGDQEKNYSDPALPWHTGEHAFWAKGNDFKIRKQLHGLFRALGKTLAESGHIPYEDSGEMDFAIKHVIAASAVPFRTPGMNDISTDMWMFSRRLWATILREWEPRLIVAVGFEAYDFIGGILGCQYIADKERRFPAFVGKLHNKLIRFIRPDGQRLTLAAFPHFARFPAFGGTDDAQASAKFLREACNELEWK